jgi:hypothetical protein
VVKIPCVSRAAAAAVKSCETITALRLGIDIAQLKLIPDIRSEDPVTDIPHEKLLLADKLMAGIQIPPRRNCQVLCTGTTPGQTLVDTRASLQINHEMEEVKPFAGSPALYDTLCKLIILLQETGKILLPDSVRRLRRRYDRLYRNLLKPLVRQAENILRKVQIVVGEGPSDIVTILPPGSCELLKLGHDQIITAFAVAEGPHAVVHILAPVHTENHIGHLAVAEIHDVIPQQNPVGRERETETLMMRLLQTASVLHKLLYHIPVHQRLSAKEINLQIDSAPGIGYQKIQRLPAGLQAHQGPAAMILALLGKTILTGQIAVMGNVKTKRLDNGLSLFKIYDQILKSILCKQLLFLHKIVNLRKSLLQVLRRIPGGKLVCNILSAVIFIHRDNIVCHVIDHMDRAAIDIHHDVIAIIFVLMNQIVFP